MAAGLGRLGGRRSSEVSRSGGLRLSRVVSGSGSGSLRLRSVSRRRRVDTSRKGRIIGGSLKKLNLSVAAAGQPREDLSVGSIPLRKFLGSNDVGVLARVEASNKPGRRDVAAADVECPADKSAILVRVESDLGVCVLVDAVFGNLSTEVRLGWREIRTRMDLPTCHR